jgi:ParB family chromosome partitioning protein
VAFAIARTLEVTLNVAEGGRRNGFHDHLGRILDIQVAQWWRPTAENFFGRVKKDIMLDALEEIGGPVMRGRYKDAKKSELATTCSSLCNGHGIVDAEIREKAVAWLPDAMRFDAIEKPERALVNSKFLEDNDEESDAIDEADGEDADLAAPDDDTGDAGESEDLSQAA